MVLVSAYTIYWSVEHVHYEHKNMKWKINFEKFALREIVAWRCTGSLVPTPLVYPSQHPAALHLFSAYSIRSSPIFLQINLFRDVNSSIQTWIFLLNFVLIRIYKIQQSLQSSFWNANSFRDAFNLCLMLPQPHSNSLWSQTQFSRPSPQPVVTSLLQ